MFNRSASKLAILLAPCDDFVIWIAERDSVYIVEGENRCGARA